MTDDMFQVNNPLAYGGRESGIRLVPFKVAIKNLWKKCKSTADLAKRLHVSSGTVNKYLNGNQQPQHPYVFENLATASKDLGMPVEYHSKDFWQQIVKVGEKV